MPTSWCGWSRSRRLKRRPKKLLSVWARDGGPSDRLGGSKSQAGLRQYDPEDGSAGSGGREGQLALVALDDHPADREAKSHSLGLRRNERVEDLFRLVAADPGPRVLHGDRGPSSCQFGV